MIVRPHRLLTLVSSIVLFGALSCSNQEPSTTTPASTTSVPASSSPPQVVGKAPPGAIVTLESAAKPAPIPEAPAVMDQYGKQFVPGELFVRVGQPVEFRNTEDMVHNVIVKRSDSGANVFHVSTDPAEKYIHKFDRAGRYDVSCDLHLGMAATIIATTSPYFAVADASGNFTIPNVEAGPYKLTALAGGQRLEQTVDVGAGRNEVVVSAR